MAIISRVLHRQAKRTKQDRDNERVKAIEDAGLDLATVAREVGTLHAPIEDPKEESLEAYRSDLNVRDVFEAHNMPVGHRTHSRRAATEANPELFEYRLARVEARLAELQLNEKAKFNPVYALIGYVILAAILFSYAVEAGYPMVLKGGEALKRVVEAGVWAYGVVRDRVA
ncbi:hypothetical protein DFP72DRAFT_1073865 [Ephemerocybe angulata]|uniref:Uncharacterized protein n=1 Tax=Ephemerocybe angulata TaxID=980116 RepID=A0A8H6HL95_9AGAR|nr:hypothetical protein DFP72DRAFT_1073865 [Tulosesus angulatus]